MVLLATIIAIAATAASLWMSGAAIGGIQHTPWNTMRYAGVVMPCHGSREFS
jgi:hypothetical protein